MVKLKTEVKNLKHNLLVLHWQVTFTYLKCYDSSKTKAQKNKKIIEHLFELQPHVFLNYHLIDYNRFAKKSSLWEIEFTYQHFSLDTNEFPPNLSFRTIQRHTTS